MRRTREAAATTRECLLDTAEQLFTARGFAATALDDVARAAGLTRGAVYWHFSNKDEVFCAVVARAVLPLDEALVQVRRDAEHDALGALRVYLGGLLRQLAQDVRFRRVLGMLLFGLHEQDVPLFARRRAGLLDDVALAVFAEMFEAAERQGQLVPGRDIELVARAFHSLLCGIVVDWLRAPGSFDVEQDGARLGEAFFECLNFAPSLGRRAPVGRPLV